MCFVGRVHKEKTSLSGSVTFVIWLAGREFARLRNHGKKCVLSVFLAGNTRAPELSFVGETCQIGSKTKNHYLRKRVRGSRELACRNLNLCTFS